MRRLKTYCLLAIVALAGGCVASKVGSATKEEELNMKVVEQRNVINSELVPPQEALTMNERLLAERGERRGLLTPLAGSMVSMATSAVKKIIANDRKKYVADYQFGLTDLYFYDQLSDEGPFDPVGLQFLGFKVIRTFVNKAGVTDTALTADFVLDTTKLTEMLNNSIFRLRLKSFDLRYAKAKVAGIDEKKLNMDFEITFVTSYVSDRGNLFDSVVLGKFYFLLREAPLDPGSVGYEQFYSNLKDSMLLGKSFIVPRSFGYHREPDGEIRSGYSQGAYSIQVKVKESSKNRFITKLVMENANVMIDATGNQIKSKLGK